MQVFTVTISHRNFTTCFLQVRKKPKRSLSLLKQPEPLTAWTNRIAFASYNIRRPVCRRVDKIFLVQIKGLRKYCATNDWIVFLVTTQDLNFASESLNIRHAVGVAECFPGEVERKSCMPYEKAPPIILFSGYFDLNKKSSFGSRILNWLVARGRQKFISSALRSLKSGTRGGASASAAEPSPLTPSTGSRAPAAIPPPTPGSS